MSTFNQTNGIEKIREEAAMWVIRLEDDFVGDDDMRAFGDWMSISETHRKIFRELSELSREFDNLGVLSRETELELPIALSQGTTDATDLAVARRWFRPSRTLAAAAMLVIIVVASFFLYPTEQIYITKIGERSVIPLPDGSIVYLNSNSQLHVHYERRQRLIELAYGEAVFEVAGIPDRPFIVKAGAGYSKALGTEFSVRSRNTDVIVTVLSGIVVVDQELYRDTHSSRFLDSGDSSTVLQAGQQVSYNRNVGRVLTLPKESLAHTVSWREGKLFFDDETLEEVISELSHYSAKKIVLADSHLQSMRVGGVFKVDDVNGILDMLESALPIDSVHASPELVILIERNSAESNSTR